MSTTKKIQPRRMSHEELASCRLELKRRDLAAYLDSAKRRAEFALEQVAKTHGSEVFYFGILLEEMLIAVSQGKTDLEITTIVGAALERERKAFQLRCVARER